MGRLKALHFFCISLVPERSSDVAVNSSEVAVWFSNVPERFSRVPERSSNLAINSSKVAVWSSRVPGNSSGLAVNSFKVPVRFSRVPGDSSGVPVRSSGIAEWSPGVRIKSPGSQGNFQSIQESIDIFWFHLIRIPLHALVFHYMGYICAA